MIELTEQEAESFAIAGYRTWEWLQRTRERTPTQEDVERFKRTLERQRMYDTKRKTRIR